MNIPSFKPSTPAFTLIESLLYFTILGVVIFVISSFAFEISSGRMKITNNLEIQENGRFVLQRLIQEIKEAKSVDLANSIFDSNSGKLVLIKDNSAESPTVFNVQNNILYITQGTKGPYKMTSNEVLVNILKFKNLTTLKSPANIKITLTLKHLNPSARKDFDAQMTWEETVAVRKG